MRKGYFDHVSQPPMVKNEKIQCPLERGFTFAYIKKVAGYFIGRTGGTIFNWEQMHLHKYLKVFFHWQRSYITKIFIIIRDSLSKG